MNTLKLQFLIDEFIMSSCSSWFERIIVKFTFYIMLIRRAINNSRVYY
jgi:hypothetical protein